MAPGGNNPMRIATLMINGCRKGSDHLRNLLGWLDKERPGVIALQKTLVREDDFPEEELGNHGYRVVSFGTGERWDWGVAILIRDDLPPARGVVKGLHCPGVTGSRFLALDIGSLRVASIYAPYGPITGIPMRRIEWLQRLREHLYEKGYAGRDSLLCGDFNVKLDKKLGKRGGYTCFEQKELRALVGRDGDFVDLYRRAHCDRRKKPGFTFGFGDKKPERGSRLHLAIASKSLAERLVCASVDTEAKIREQTRPLLVKFADPSK